MKERSPPLRQCKLSACPVIVSCGLTQVNLPPCGLISGSLVQPVPLELTAGGSGPPRLPTPSLSDGAAVLSGDLGGRGLSGGAVWIMIGGTAAHFFPDLVEVASSICQEFNVWLGNSWVVCAIPAEESIQHYERSYGKHNTADCRGAQLQQLHALVLSSEWPCSISLIPVPFSRAANPSERNPSR